MPWASYGYDKDNHLARVTDWQGRVTTTSYDGAGRAIGTAYANGIAAVAGYDNADQLLNLRYSHGATALGTFSYTYDAVGNQRSATDSSGTTSYAYDALDRLTTVHAPGATTTYTYDAVGNRLSLTSGATTTSYTYNAADEVLQSGATRYTYDADGNRVTATIGGATTTYTYDDANYLTGIAKGTTSSSYTYNGDHVRVGSKVNGVTTRDLVDLAAPLSTVLQQTTGVTTTNYLYGDGLLGQDNGGSLQFLLPDALGSVRLVTNGSGAVIGTASYDAFGAQTTTGASSEFGYAGQQLDPESGLLYLRARMYDPSTGVFLSVDPLLAETGQPYAYTGDNPVNLTDLTGQERSEAVNPWEVLDAADFLHSLSELGEGLTGEVARQGALATILGPLFMAAQLTGVMPIVSLYLLESAGNNVQWQLDSATNESVRLQTNRCKNYARIAKLAGYANYLQRQLRLIHNLYRQTYEKAQKDQAGFPVPAPAPDDLNWKW
jgi:RHS repeat-associated protein